MHYLYNLRYSESVEYMIFLSKYDLYCNSTYRVLWGRLWPYIQNSGNKVQTYLNMNILSYIFLSFTSGEHISATSFVIINYQS